MELRQKCAERGWDIFPEALTVDQPYAFVGMPLDEIVPVKSVHAEVIETVVDKNRTPHSPEIAKRNFEFLAAAIKKRNAVWKRHPVLRERT